MFISLRQLHDDWVSSSLKLGASDKELDNSWRIHLTRAVITGQISGLQAACAPSSGEPMPDNDAEHILASLGHDATPEQIETLSKTYQLVGEPDMDTQGLKDLHALILQERNGELGYITLATAHKNWESPGTPKDTTPVNDGITSDNPSNVLSLKQSQRQSSWLNYLESLRREGVITQEQVYCAPHVDSPMPKNDIGHIILHNINVFQHPGSQLISTDERNPDLLAAIGDFVETWDSIGRPDLGLYGLDELQSIQQIYQEEDIGQEQTQSLEA